MKLIPKGKGLWQIVTATEKEPTEAMAKNKYLHRRDQALTKILLVIDDSFIAAVVNTEGPSDFWEKLKNKYESVSRAHVDASITQLLIE